MFSFSKGEIVLKDEPYACAVGNEVLSLTCSYCFATQEMKKCPRCNVVSYCSPDCQSKDKDFHAVECDILQAYSSIPDMEARLVIRALAREAAERKVGRVSNGDFFGNRRTVEDLVTHLDVLSADEYKAAAEEACVIHGLVKEFLATSLNDALEMLQKVKINSQSVTDYDEENFFTRGVALYLGASKADHTCEISHDYVQMFIGRNIILRALRNFTVSDPNSLMIQYMSPSLPYAERREYSLNRYYFLCSCSKCVREARAPMTNRREPKLIGRAMALFDSYSCTREWFRRGVRLWKKMRSLGKSHGYTHWLLVQLQITSSELGSHRVSLRFGLGALSGAYSVTDMERILICMCSTMDKMGWNDERSANKQKFMGLCRRTSELLAITHGMDNPLYKKIDSMQHT